MKARDFSSPLFKIGDKVRVKATGKIFVVQGIGKRLHHPWAYYPNNEDFGVIEDELELVEDPISALAFEDALVALKEGSEIARASWHGTRSLKLTPAGLIQKATDSGRQQAMDRFTTQHLLAVDWTILN